MNAPEESMKISAALLIAASICGCSKMNSALWEDDYFHANVVSRPYVQTKSANDGCLSCETIDLGNGFCLTQYVYDMECGPESYAPSTKGTVVSTSNFFSIYGDMSVEAYLGPGRTDLPSHYVVGNVQRKVGPDWKWYDRTGLQPLVDNEAPRWVNGVDTYIWCLSPAAAPGLSLDDVDKDDASDAELRRLSFHYVSDPDVLNQNDLLVAFNKERRSFEGNASLDGKPNTFDVSFCHALSAVSFEASATGLESVVDIQDVELRRLHSSASCVATGSMAGVDFAWTPDDAAQSAVSLHGVGRVGLSAENMTAFVIPQSTAGMRIFVSFVKHGITINREIPLNAFRTGSFQAGKSYRYVLSASIHVPGEQIPFPDPEFSYKGFKNNGGVVFFDNGGKGFNVVGVKKIGITVNHTYVDSAGHSTAYIYVSNMDGSMTSRNSGPISYDFRPVPSVPSYPYDGGDGFPENYQGIYQMTDTSGTSYYVFDVTGFKYFKVVCEASGSSNNARWSGSFFKYYILEVEPNVQ